MNQRARTAAGGRIDRSRTLRFSFDGRSCTGFPGDTLASALLANDVHLVGRSFKYHRPRGILAAGSEEPNALVTIDRGSGRTTPNLRATQVELYDGLVARSQNRFPSLRFDFGAVAGWAAPLLASGFYYKTFMWPRSFWHRVYEPAIRRAAGLGRAPAGPDADRYMHQYAHCDLLIIGGGPAGLAAALAASATGARVILCDEQPRLGGSLLDEPQVTIDGSPAIEWVHQAVASLAGTVTLLPRTTAFGWYADRLIGLAQRLTDHLAEPASTLPRERLWQVRAGQVIVAAGAIERPLVFPGNDRPGIMLAGAARTYLHRYGVTPGRRVLIATTDDSAYRTAVDLRAAGVAVAAIVDQRPNADTEAVLAARRLDIPIHPGRTIGMTGGHSRVHSARIADTNDVISCDTILMSGGWTPSVHLLSQSREPLLFDTASGTYLPRAGAVGACAGVFDLAACLRDASAAGGSARSFTVTGLSAMTPPSPAAHAVVHRSAFVDLQNDVTTKDLAIATQEGFRAVEHVKRYTTTGMATDQGKTSGLNTLAALASLTGQPIEALGHTTFRPPYTPVSFGALAGAARGRLFAPLRVSPITDPAAVIDASGAWCQATCYIMPDETVDAAVARECRAVRNDSGMADLSALGKIEVVGPDAAAFLSRIYTADCLKLAPGRCRYALLLSEDGFIRDDSIVARLTGDRFHVTTTPAAADFVLHHMEEHLQTHCPGLRLWLTAVTEQWAVIALHGPTAAEVLAPFILDIDLAAMPHMGVRAGHMDDVPIRLCRVSAVGEIGFEISLPAREAQRAWDTLRQRGVTPCGTLSIHILRAEKGRITIGQETDGTVTPADVGLQWTIGGDGFVGQRSLSLADLTRPDRPQLVGLLPKDPGAPLEEGAQLSHTPSGPPVGHVTTFCPAGTSGRGFTLAMLSGGRGNNPADLFVRTAAGGIPVTVVGHVFIDKQRAKLRPRAVPRTARRPLLAAAKLPMPLARPASGVQMAVLAPTTRLSVRGGPAAATAIGLAIEVLLPTVPCRSVIARNRAALWLGPDEWLIIGPENALDLTVRAMNAASHHLASVVDISHRSHTLELSGPYAAWCLNGFCALDLDIRAFPVGMCTRTLFGKVGVILWRIGQEVFQLDVGRSLLPYIWDCLEEARLEFTDAAVV